MIKNGDIALLNMAISEAQKNTSRDEQKKQELLISLNQNKIRFVKAIGNEIDRDKIKLIEELAPAILGEGGTANIEERKIDLMQMIHRIENQDDEKTQIDLNVLNLIKTSGISE